MAYLVLVRHGQSEWNALGKWTGWHDVPLTEQGKAEAREAAKSLKNMQLHKAYTAKLTRSQQTLDEIKHYLRVPELETISDKALNERNYGDYTGLNKWDVLSSVGEEEFLRIRRAWDYPLHNGESLKDVYERVIPYYETHILADLKSDKNVLISAHGNSLRALVKYLEAIPDERIHKLEIATGEVYMYQVNKNGKITNKTIFNSAKKA